MAQIGQNGHLTHRGSKRTQRTKGAKAYETDKYDGGKQVENDSEKVGKVPTPRYPFAYRLVGVRFPR
jgi:hypothetical protein